MKTYTIDDIRDLEPCYDPSKYLAESWTGTVVDVLRLSAVPPDDRIWAATHLLDNEKTLRLFAVWCARDALSRVENPDQRSIDACDVAERFTHGDTTVEELDAAWSAANATAWSTATAAAFARSAADAATAYSAAQSAAYAASRSATAAAWSADAASRSAATAYSAAQSAADTASRSAADAAATAATASATTAATASADTAVYPATFERFAEHLAKMIERANP